MIVIEEEVMKFREISKRILGELELREGWVEMIEIQCTHI